jgi:hypothetical protein
MNEFVTHVLISFAMGDWKKIKRMARDCEREADWVQEEAMPDPRVIHSSIQGILEQPAKEPLLIS